MADIHVNIESKEGAVIRYEGDSLEYVEGSRYRLVLEAPDFVSKIKVSHSRVPWNAWEFFFFKVYALPSADLALTKATLVYDSTSIFGKVRLMLADLTNLGLSSDKTSELSELLDSALFRAQWADPNGKTHSLFTSTARAIEPYSVGAHGFSLPLSGQDMDIVLSRFPDIKALLDSLGVPWFCTSGTLLGLVRDNRLIEYDDDLDFVFYLGEVSKPAAICEALKAIQPRLNAIARPGINPFQYTMNGDVGAVDLFASWSDPTGRMWVYPWCPAKLSYADLLPVSTLEFAGVSLNAPRNREKALELNYGQKWKTPDPLWRFDWEASNVAFAEYITYAEAGMPLIRDPA
jgi:hypothetical protein